MLFVNLDVQNTGKRANFASEIITAGGGDFG